MAKNWWEGDAVADESTDKWWANDAVYDEARRDLSPGSTPSTAGAGRGLINPPPNAPLPNLKPAPRPVAVAQPTAAEPDTISDDFGGAAIMAQNPDAYIEVNRAPSIMTGRTFEKPTVDAELNRQAMIRSGSPESVMFKAGRAKQAADDMIAIGIKKQQAERDARDLLRKNAQAEDYGFTDFAKDTGLDLTKGVAGLGEAYVGLLDITSGGAAGRVLSDVGYDPKAVNSFLTGFQSLTRKNADKDVQDAAGFIDTLKALAVNPTALIGSVAESLPGTITAGASAGKFVRLLAGQASKEAVALGLEGAAAKDFITQKIKDQTFKIAAVAGGSEGLQSAGSIAEAGRQSGEDWSTYVTPAIAAGLGTAAIAIVSGGVAKKLGIGDLETHLATRTAGFEGIGAGEGSAVTKLFKEVAKEGLLEEMPQSAQEQIFQNLATNRPWDENIGQAAAQGLVSGIAMAGGHSTAASLVEKASNALQTPERELSRALDLGVANTEFNPAVNDALARRALDVQSYDANIISPTQTARIDRAQSILSQATTVEDMTGAANELAGNLNEMLVPENAVTPLPPVLNEPTLTNEPIPLAPGPVEPALTNEPITPVSVETEQQFGLDKLRMNAPRPQSIQGKPVASLTDDELSATIADSNVSAITRRSAEVELKARQAEQAPEVAAVPTATTPNAPAATTTATEAIPDVTGTLGSTPVRNGAPAPVGELPGADTARANAQRSVDRWATAQGVASPIQFNPAPPEETSAVSQIGQALNSQFGTRLFAYHDTNPSAPNGVAIAGTGFVNTGSVAINVGRTSLHEFKHTIEQIAKAEADAGLTNTPAQQFTSQIDSIFDDMTDEGKRAYIENFLHTEDLAGITDPAAREARIQQYMTAPLTRSEMTADFLGNRATDKKFWASVAKADPQGFKGFVDKWLGIIDGLLDRLRGTAKQGKYESARVDKYVQDLNRAKMVARDALVAYRKGTLQQFAPQGEVSGSANNAVTGSQNVPGIAASARPESSQAGRAEIPSYGTGRQGAISVVGRHYSSSPQQSLSGAYYGRGLKGAERNRLDSSTDPRLKNRIYFYVDQGSGIRPESGVGGYAHEVKLDNIYDPQTGIVRPQSDLNGFESAVINAGFDGYIAPFGNNQAAVVLLGQKHKAVPVKQIGQPASAPLPQAAAPTTLKKGLLSREANAIDVSKIPGAKMRMGSLEIPAEQTAAANAELERIGSDVRFSKQRNEEEPLAKAVKAEGAKATAVVSAKPGREFKIGNDTASIVTYPKANDLEFVTSRLHARVREALTGSDATNFLAATFGLKGQSLKNLAEIRGLWNTEREDTFAITASKADGSPADFEDSRKLANLLGFAFIQEGAVTIEPSHKSNESIPSVLIGKPDGSKLTRSEIDSALSAANDAGFFGASEALSGKGVKFLFFADDSSSKSTEDQYRDFVDQIATVQKSTGLTAAGNFNTNSRLDDANEYWTNATGQSLSENIGGAGNQTASGEPSNIFRGTVDSLLAPYISALSTEGFKFDIEQWQRVFGATDAQSSYLKLKLAELDNVNKHGVVPKLRQQVPITNLKQVGSKALITQKTTEANATEQLAALDKVLAGSSNPVKNTEAWLRMEAMAYGTNDVPMAPNRFIKMYNGDGIYEQLKSLSPGQVSDAQQGAEMGQEFRALYESGKVSPAVTAKLMLWSFLSRGVSPYVQESAFVDLVDKIDPFIPRVLNGTFSDDDAAAWNKIVAQTISKGSGQPGAATTHNANAFGGSFMRGMAAAAPNGRTKMQYLHELFSDPTKSGPEIRREFIKMGEGVGIDNKVISFTLLVIGHDDVIVLDRVQIANTFNDGRLGDYNLYDGVSRYGYKDATGKTVWLGVTPADYAEAKDKAGDDEVISAKLPGSGMANLTTGARGLMIYEPLEGALQKVLPGIFDRLKADGLRSADTRPSVGRWHWEGWVAYSGQEASHKTLEALLAEAKGEKNPFADVSAKEGEYGAFSYGTEYARDINGTAYKLYFDSKGVPYRFTLDSYKTLMSELKKKGKDGVVPGNFKVSTNEDGTQRSAPWFKDPRVNLAKFDEMIHRLGTANIKASPTRQTETAAIFAGLEKRGLAKAKAETALAEHPDSARIKYVQENFLDILSELEDSDLVKINCD